MAHAEVNGTYFQRVQLIVGTDINQKELRICFACSQSSFADNAARHRFQRHIARHELRNCRLPAIGRHTCDACQCHCQRAVIGCRFHNLAALAEQRVKQIFLVDGATVIYLQNIVLPHRRRVKYGKLGKINFNFASIRGRHKCCLSYKILRNLVAFSSVVVELSIVVDNKCGGFRRHQYHIINSYAIALQRCWCALLSSHLHHANRRRRNCAARIGQHIGNNNKVVRLWFQRKVFNFQFITRCCCRSKQIIVGNRPSIQAYIAHLSAPGKHTAINA